MAKRLIERDPYSLTEVWHEYDPVTKVTTIAEISDVEPVLEGNKRVDLIGTPGGRLNEYERQGVKKEMAHVARVPNNIITIWKKKYGVDVFKANKCDWTWKRMRQLLNSPDWRYLRTGKMRI